MTSPAITTYRGVPLLRSIRTTSFLCLLMLARAAYAQDPVDANNGLGQWAPMGRLPVDQAGAGRRGYALAGESTEVAAPGTSRISIHAVAANNFYREQSADFSISQRYETHTLALGYRRGFAARRFPGFELGGQIQLTEGDNGFMNGFISGTENFLAWMTGQESARNPLRRSGVTPPPLGTLVTKGGQPFYQGAGDAAGFGSFSLIAKALIRDGDPSSGRTRVAVRAAATLSGKTEFREGNFTGIGASLDKKVLPWAALHGDVRASFLMDRVSHLNLPLKRTSIGFTVGPELRLSQNTSASAQIDGSTTPYLPTGTAAFDRGYGDITLGLSHRFRPTQRPILAQVYLRENMNLPFRIRWNTDPDLSIGVNITIHAAR